MRQSNHDHFSEAHRLAISRPVGMLNMRLANQLMKFVLALEDTQRRPFNRLLDLGAIREVRLTGVQVYKIAQMRRGSTFDLPPFHTAILASTPLAYGVGHLYQVLMDGSNVKVRVTRTPEEAAKWLSVPVAIIDGGKDETHAGRR